MPKIEDETNEKHLTAAELTRRKRRRQKRKLEGEEAPKETKADIDDEIRRLEAELQAMSSSDDESFSSVDDEKEAVVAMFSIKDERIASLPASALPAVPPRPTSSTKKKQRKTQDATQPLKSDKTAPIVSQGLKDAVQEVLRGYKPRSAEHLPFYCRCCAKQYDDMEQFQAHKETDFHKAACELERKASFCRSCRKQLTSPAQLQEHLRSRPHKERLQHLKANQQKRSLHKF